MFSKPLQDAFVFAVRVRLLQRFDVSEVAVDEHLEGRVRTCFGPSFRGGRHRVLAAPFQFMASLTLRFERLRRRDPSALPLALTAFAPLDEIRALCQHGPIVMTARLLKNGAQDPFATHFDLRDDGDSPRGTLRIP